MHHPSCFPSTLGVPRGIGNNQLLHQCNSYQPLPGHVTRRVLRNHPLHTCKQAHTHTHAPTHMRKEINFCMHPTWYTLPPLVGLIYPNILKFNPADVIKQVKTFNITGVNGSPAFVEKIAHSYAAKQNVTLPVLLCGEACVQGQCEGHQDSGQ